MKKISIVLFLFIIICNISACSFKNVGNSKFLKSGGKKQLQEDANEIVEAIESNDADKIKKMFAKNAIKNIKEDGGSLEEEIKILFDAYGGKMKSCTYVSGRESTRSNGAEGDFGQEFYKEATGTFEVETDEDTYNLFIVHDVQGTTKADTGIFCIVFERKFDADSLNLLDFCVEAHKSGITVVDTTVMREMEQQMQAEGKSGFDGVMQGYALDVAVVAEHYHKGNKNAIEEFKDLFAIDVDSVLLTEIIEKLDFNLGEKAESVSSGFDDGNKLMYCEGIGYYKDLSLEDKPVKYRISMKWQKCADDKKSGLTYFAIMSEEDYKSGKEFPKGEGVFFVK